MSVIQSKKKYRAVLRPARIKRRFPSSRLEVFGWSKTNQPPLLSEQGSFRFIEQMVLTKNIPILPN